MRGRHVARGSDEGLKLNFVIIINLTVSLSHQRSTLFLSKRNPFKFSSSLVSGCIQIRKVWSRIGCCLLETDQFPRKSQAYELNRSVERT